MRLVPFVLPTQVDALELKGAARVRQQSRRAREALALSAAACRAALGPLEKDGEDAPLPSNGWHWSLAHAREFAAGVVCREPVGIDVEKVEPRRPDAVASVTSHDELLLFGGFTWRVFFRAWTAKEAVLKKAGCGIAELAHARLVAVNDHGCVVAHRGREHFVHQREHAGHWLALAHDGPLDALVEWRCEAEAA